MSSSAFWSSIDVVIKLHTFFSVLFKHDIISLRGILLEEGGVWVLDFSSACLFSFTASEGATFSAVRDLTTGSGVYLQGYCRYLLANCLCLITSLPRVILSSQHLVLWYVRAFIWSIKFKYSSGGIYISSIFKNINFDFLKYSLTHKLSLLKNTQKNLTNQ